jgi:serine/threonine protein phosphatase PrpC
MVAIDAAGLTHIGGRNENQDHFFIQSRRFGVLDGHGRIGAKMANAASISFEAAPLDTDFYTMFNNAEEVVATLVPTYFPATLWGGTTASILQIDDNGTCHVAHVGDSEIHCFDADFGDGVALTSDHSACSLNEFLRISKTVDPARFEFVGTPAKPVFKQQDDTTWAIDPAGGNCYNNVHNDWAAYVVYGGEYLAMTRALGDFSMKRHGIIAEPSVKHVAPFAGTRAIVLASDGLWNILRKMSVRRIVRRPDLIGNARAATDVLMGVALSVGHTLYGSDLDNITVLVVYVTV